MSEAGGGAARARLEALYRQHHGATRGFFIGKGMGVEEAKDLTQKTFLRACGSWHQYRGEAPEEVWLRGIAIRVAQDHWRRAGRQKRAAPEVSIDTLGGEIQPTALVATEPSGLGQVIRRETKQQVEAALEDLPERMRLAIKLSLRQGLKQREIAAVLKISVGTVKSQLFEARLKLQKSLVHLRDES
jgi:RNA polymerase sigma-70 factor (ECF subfamily)